MGQRSFFCTMLVPHLALQLPGPGLGLLGAAAGMKMLLLMIAVVQADEVAIGKFCGYETVRMTADLGANPILIIRERD